MIKTFKETFKTYLYNLEMDETFLCRAGNTK